MYRTAARQNGRRATYRVVEMPAPVGGINARDSITAMNKLDAVRLVNLFPKTTDVVLREGYANHATGMSGQVNSVLVYNKPDGTTKMFAAVGANIYDVSSSGAVGAAVVTGLTSDKWQYVNFATTGGTFLYIVNGADDPLLYDGTTWTAINGASTPAVTGVTTNTLINISVHKSRIWFIEENSLKAWYLPAGSVGGAAVMFDFRPVFKKGGYLVASTNVTFDGGSGIDDQAVFMTSEGEVAIYHGSDPASAFNWALVGVFQFGNPVGNRCFDKFKGDVIVITRDGLVPLSKGLVNSSVNKSSALTDKISQAITQLTLMYGGSFGWQTCLYPQQNMMLLNVPVTGGQYQFAMNTITGSWGLFKGWNANCWARNGESLYFGGNGVVGRIYNSVLSDNGNNIVTDALQAFNKFGSDENKHFKMAQPIAYASSQIGIAMSINVDYSTADASGDVSTSATTGGVWDTALWDDAEWGGESLSQNWQTVGAIGYTAAIAMMTATKADTFRWEATRYVLEYARGNPL